MDLVYVVSTLVVTAALFGFVALCARVEKRP